MQSRGDNMAISIKRLGAGDETILEFLALHDAEFDVEDRSVAGQPLSPEKAKRFLEHPDMLFWVAFSSNAVVGFLQCNIILLRSNEALELLLYEIGVHQDWRRRGIGRALLNQMETWMQENTVAVVWVLADNQEAVEFYRSSGFEAEDPQPTYMLRELE
jgi:ribosomal protein S18 acetylase RimI-like enzyme